MIYVSGDSNSIELLLRRTLIRSVILFVLHLLMAKIILHLATSLDGFIADEHGGVDWLNDFPNPGEDYGMNEFFSQCGTAIMGSKTYEQTLSFNYWYEGMDGIVFTSRNLPVLKDKSIKFLNGDPKPIVEELRKKEKDSWLVGGGILIAHFINHHLIDEFTITIVPRLLGKGLALCPLIDHISKLRLLDSKTYEDGVVQLRYCF
jgi:dihydrofolate reductase